MFFRPNGGKVSHTWVSRASEVQKKLLLAVTLSILSIAVAVTLIMGLER